MRDDRYKDLMQQVGIPDSQSLLAALQQAVNEATHEERKRCAEMVPTTWLDPLLTGDDAAIPKVGEKINGLHIEALLRGIRDRIRDR